MIIHPSNNLSVVAVDSFVVLECAMTPSWNVPKDIGPLLQLINDFVQVLVN